MTRPGAGDVVGVVLAAGAGTRMGRPKALVGEGDDSWLRRAVAVLRGGGCGHVVVVLGAEARQARRLVGGPDVTVIEAEDWSGGLSASLSAGLRSLAEREEKVAVITLVDLPDLVPAVVDRLLAEAGTADDVLARATYGGLPGHPVLLGRRHWAPLAAELTGDVGARDYLARQGARPVECADLATGRDRDRPEAAAGVTDSGWNTRTGRPRQDSNL